MPHDGVDFPMADGASSFGDGWPFSDMALTGQAAPAVVCTVALSPPLGGLSQVPVQVAASGFVGPDMLIDGLVADQHDAVKAQMPSDLFRAPARFQIAVNNREMGIIELSIASGNRAAMAAPAICPEGPIVAVRWAGVTSEFAGDRAGRSTELSGDVGL